MQLWDGLGECFDETVGVPCSSFSSLELPFFRFLQFQPPKRLDLLRNLKNKDYKRWYSPERRKKRKSKKSPKTKEKLNTFGFLKFLLFSIFTIPYPIFTAACEIPGSDTYTTKHHGTHQKNWSISDHWGVYVFNGKRIPDGDMKRFLN